MTTRRLMVRHLAGPGVASVREVMTSPVPDVVKAAALVEIAGAAAALARTIVKLRRIDPAVVDAYVADRVDSRAVLGRGRWLPTMVRPVQTPPSGPAPLLAPVVPIGSASPRRRVAGRGPVQGQAALFSLTAARGGDRWNPK